MKRKVVQSKDPNRCGLFYCDRRMNRYCCYYCKTVCHNPCLNHPGKCGRYYMEPETDTEGRHGDTLPH